MRTNGHGQPCRQRTHVAFALVAVEVEQEVVTAPPQARVRATRATAAADNTAEGVDADVCLTEQVGHDSDAGGELRRRTPRALNVVPHGRGLAGVSPQCQRRIEQAFGRGSAV